MSNELAVKETALAAADKYDKVAAEAHRVFHDAIINQSRTTRVHMQIAKAMHALNDLVDNNVLAMLRQLEGDADGFLADKAYDDQTLKRVYVQASIRGLAPMGNEWNIIGGKLYVTQNGWQRLIDELGTVSELVTTPGDVEVKGEVAKVEFAANWLYEGEYYTRKWVKSENFDGRISVRHNRGATVDAAIGKALARVLRAIHREATGVNTGEQDDIPATPANMSEPPDKLFDKGSGVPA